MERAACCGWSEDDLHCGGVPEMEVGVFQKWRWGCELYGECMLEKELMSGGVIVIVLIFQADVLSAVSGMEEIVVSGEVMCLSIGQNDNPC